MAQMQDQPANGKTKRKLHSQLSIDMTPMVDLGFLLITFFIFHNFNDRKKSDEFDYAKRWRANRLAGKQSHYGYSW